MLLPARPISHLTTNGVHHEVHVHTTDVLYCIITHANQVGLKLYIFQKELYGNSIARVINKMLCL